MLKVGQPKGDAGRRKTRLRWLRFSLRTLLLFITVLGVWLALQVGAARRQRDAVAMILRPGGSLVYDYETQPIAGQPAFFFDMAKQPAEPGPKWLRALMGEDFFRNPIRVVFEKSTLSSEEFAQLKSLPRLRMVSLSYVKIKEQNGDERPVGDAELKILAGLKELRFLDIDGGEFSQASLAELANVPLYRLMLWDCKLDSHGVKEIGRITSLELLSLVGTQLTEQDLANLRPLYKLISLDLSKTGVTDEGVKHLAGFLNLQDLRLTATQVTAEGVARLHKALPQTGISGR